VSVTRGDIERIAALAELGVDEAAAGELQRQLTRILEYVAQLAEVTDDATAAGDERAARLRRDVVDPDPLARAPREFAPGFTDGLFTVPRLGELDRGDEP
jgi:aspartyl/glutamyl-tRNA(Asn/Gln) amidotransferase C subunit